MARVQVALVGTSPDPILVGVRELGAERVILMGRADQEPAAREIAKVLEPLGVETEWRVIEGMPLLGAIQTLQTIVREHRARKQDLVVNLGAADKGDVCAGLSAAFVAGVEAVDVMEGAIVHMPVLHFAYEEVVSETKLHILQGLDQLGGTTKELRKLAEAAHEKDSDVSYHIRGGKDAKGLVDLGLVELDRGDGGLTITLTPMGELLARGMSAA